MNTVLGELIDWTYHMEESIASITYTDADFRLLKQLREKFESFLPQERQQIIDAGNNCANVLIANDIVTQGDHDKTVGENYYDQHFGKTPPPQ
jgi:hypothetical protein